jgi:hypothetical protein
LSIILLLGLLVAVLGLRLINAERPEDPLAGGPSVFWTIFAVVAGLFTLGLGIVGYVVVVQTQCLTLSFDRPFWSAYKKKLYLANIVVPLLLTLGVAFFVSAIVTPMLQAAGVLGVVAFTVPLMGTVFILQIGTFWFDIWKPLDQRIVRKRLLARGVPFQEFAKGIYVGISDPTKSSRKTFGGIEHDIGMLWIDPGSLRYIGDNDQFDISRSQLMEVDRRADPVSSTYLSGMLHVIFRFVQPNGVERQVRLHTEDSWTMGERTKKMNRLAEAITLWRNAPTSPPVPPPLAVPPKLRAD